MKSKLTRQFIALIALLGFLAIMAGNASAANESRATDNGNEEIVVSPYWQSDSGSYTFIAVSHTSLSGMASQVGVTISAIPNNIGSTTTTLFGSALTFTVTSGTTQRVFITRTNHATINPTSIPSAQFITGTTNFSHGTLRVTKMDGSYPKIPTHPTVTRLSAGIQEVPTSLAGAPDQSGEGWRDPTMLSFWGSVVVEKNTTGFAMEFIGDMNDSQGGYAIDEFSVISGVSAP